MLRQELCQRQREEFRNSGKACLLFFTTVAAFVLLGCSSSGDDSFVPGDIDGEWVYHGVVAGDVPAQTTGWYHGMVTINNGGEMTFTTPVSDSLGNADYTPGSGTLSFSGNGEITSQSLDAVRGAINPQSNIFALVGTFAPGSSDAVNGYNLQLAFERDLSLDYLVSDFEGSWSVHGITTGDSPQFSGWLNGTFTFDGSGSFVAEGGNSQGDDFQQTGTVAMSASGVISVEGSDTDGLISTDKQVACMTQTDGGGGSNLLVLLKSGAEFTGTDLAGTWIVNLLFAGDSPQFTGWMYGSLVLDADGAGTLAIFRSQDGESSATRNVAFSISSEGAITEAATDIQGAMDTNKEMMVLTQTDGGGGPVLWVAFKR